jgi:ribose transport system ATP-binding protein
MSKTLLELNSLSKKFSNRQILDTISLNINVQTLNILIGENGAGKSTLAHILAGVFHPDTGTILLDGSEVKLNSPLAAHQHGIYTLYQETSLFENFTVGENILHNCASPNKFKSKKQLHQRAQEILDLFGIPLQSRDIVSSLNLPLKRMVELASIINKKPKLLILDEPTISFTNIEIEKICDLLLQYKKQGGTVLFITQKFSPVFHIADTITVLKKGRITGKKCSCNTDYNDLISMLAGEQCHHSFPKLQVKKGKEIFAVENMGTATFLKDISFSAKSGEIIGITGMVGSGKTMVARTILGLEKKNKGISVCG